MHLIKSIDVPAQTDSQYSDISSNQCSWCAVEFALHASKFRALYRIPDINEIHNLYIACMKEGSELRRKYGTFLYGENIDSQNLLDYYKKSYDVLQKRSIHKNVDEDFLKILHTDLRSEFYTRKYDDSNTIEDILRGIAISTSLLVSRHGQSLCVVPFGGDYYIVLDSHLHKVQLMTFQETVAHICMDHGGAQNITLLHGTSLTS
jgi:hypothetical protein